MKIDLHCHTKKCKQGDPSTRNIDAKGFAQTINAAGVSIVAITNHNHFDLDQYNEFASAVEDDDVQIWPGAEFDVKGSREGSHWHVLVIASPRKAIEFDEAVRKLTKGVSPDECLLQFDDVYGAFPEGDAIFVSHCHQKKPYVNEEDIEEILSRTTSPWLLFFEPSSLISLGIWSNHGWNMMLGSDVQDWSKYRKIKLPDLRLPVSSFEQFVLLAKRDNQTITTLLNEKSPKQTKTRPHESVEIEIPIYEDVNVIFGQKGTGKSEIIKSLKEHYDAQGKVVSAYYGSSKLPEYEKLLSLDGVCGNPHDFGRVDGVGAIAGILEWTDSTPTPYEQYVKWWSTRENNAKKLRFRISDSEALTPISRDGFDRHKSAYVSVAHFKDEYAREDYGSYLGTDQKAAFEETLDTLMLNAMGRARSAYIEMKATSLANCAIESIKNLIDTKSDTKSKPSTTGFASFALNRLQLHGRASLLVENTKEGARQTDEYLGSLEGKGPLRLVTQYRYLCPKSRTAEFSKGITNLREWKRALTELAEGVFADGLAEKLASFKEVCERTSIKDLSDFIGVSRFVVLQDGTPYQPSDGEKGIILLERKLKESADVYLLDEPESGMSNSYIDAVIRPLVQDLGKRGQTVVLATHNANLAVRTLPYSSIYREHVGDCNYKTYEGNPFVNELVDVDDSANRLSWSEISMKTLEGGREAFYERMTIYEAGQR